MSTNKHASIRYQALDRCFSNFRRQYFIENLVEACNKALYEYAGVIDGVKKRQVQEDIVFMESDAGWSIPLQHIKDGKRTYYRYGDAHFSINQRPLNETDARQLRETILMLNRFKGMPQFIWMEELLARLENTFHLKNTSANVVGFEQNPYLKGLNFFTDLFNAIINKQPLNIVYQRYAKPPMEMVLHPYFLKQYNNRWFLFGQNLQYASKMSVTNLALDRIEAITPVNVAYIENRDIDFDEYFDDVVGVTVHSDKKVEKITLEVDDSILPYIKTKPLHGSQKLHKSGNGTAIIELELMVNYEFETQLLGYAHSIHIIEPIHLKEKICVRAQQIIDKNIVSVQI